MLQGICWVWARVQGLLRQQAPYGIKTLFPYALLRWRENVNHGYCQLLRPREFVPSALPLFDKVLGPDLLYSDCCFNLWLFFFFLCPRVHVSPSLQFLASGVFPLLLCVCLSCYYLCGLFFVEQKLFSKLSVLLQEVLLSRKV